MTFSIADIDRRVEPSINLSIRLPLLMLEVDIYLPYVLPRMSRNGSEVKTV